MEKLLIGGSVVLVVIMFALALHESSEWEKFKVEHKCRVVAKIDGEVFNTFGVDSNGMPTVGIGSTSSKTGWLCDDGVTYYK